MTLLALLLAGFAFTLLFFLFKFALGTVFELNSARPRPVMVADVEAVVIDEWHSQAVLYPLGREVFFPGPRTGARVYDVTIAGLLRSENGQLSDAFYRTDDSGNFTESSCWVRVNGYALHQCSHEVLDHDRYHHRYTVRVDGFSSQLTLAIHGPWAHRARWTGSLTANVTLLPPGTPTIMERQERAKQDARKRHAAQEAHDATAQMAKQFSDLIERLTIQSETFKNWEDPQYRQKFAEVHHEDLIRRQAEIRAEAIQFLSQHEAIRYFARHDPRVIQRFTGHLQTLHLAEQIALTKRLPPVEVPPRPKRKLTAAEVRAIKVQHQQVEIGDRLALKLDKVETRLKIREHLATMPFSDEEEREAVEQELIREIEENDGDAAKTL